MSVPRQSQSGSRPTASRPAGLGAAAPDPGLAFDALAGADGTQEPPPPPVFTDALAGLVTAERPPTPSRVPVAPVVVPAEPDREAVARAARELAAEPARHAGPSRPRRAVAAPRRTPVPRSTPPARQPQAIRPAADARPAARRRRPIGGWLIALLVLAVIGFNLIRGLLEQLVHLVH